MSSAEVMEQVVNEALESLQETKEGMRAILSALDKCHVESKKSVPMLGKLMLARTRLAKVESNILELRELLK